MARASGKTKASKPLSKKVKIPPVHLKRPGFNAFMTTPPGAVSSARNKKRGRVACQKVAAPETGIHSLGWAAMIAPNTSGLFKLSAELRLRIWEDVIEAIKIPVICPHKALDKFKTPLCKTLEGMTWANKRRATLEYACDSFGEIIVGLYTLCRQAYVDIYGSALIYRIMPFHFHSPDTMLNYLSVINPLHRNSIRSLILDCKLYKNNSCRFATNSTWIMLQSLESLQNLDIVFSPHETLTQHDIDHNWGSRAPYRYIHSIRSLYFLEFIRKIKEHEGLKTLRGLKNFVLYLNGCSSEQEEMMDEVCEDIKTVVLLENAVPMVGEENP